MRRVERLETLYLDFDGFFASVMQQAMPALRNRPVGVIPFDMKAVESTSMIACSKEAKRRGVSNVMRAAEARRRCPEIIFVPQRPDLVRRAHHALLNEIACVAPIDAVKSIDELAVRLDKRAAEAPDALASQIKKRLRENIGPFITCSIGFAANRLLAKIACKRDKPDGVTIWRPSEMPGPLLSVPLSDVPGVGSRMETRLRSLGISTTEELLNTQPKQLRKLWRNVQGERLWYALHGYALQAEPTQRAMYGHGRVLPPEWRTLERARDCSRLLLTKAARRMRRDGFYARELQLWLQGYGSAWTEVQTLPSVNDDHACLEGLERLWRRARTALSQKFRAIRCGVTLGLLVPASARQLELFREDVPERRKWEKLTEAMDALNYRNGRRVISLGVWTPPPGGFAGGKIAFTRIPSAEDFL